MREKKEKLKHILLSFCIMLFFSNLYIIKVFAYNQEEENIIYVACWNRDGHFNIENDGTVKGYDVELLKKLSVYTRDTYKYIVVSSLEEAIEKLNNKEVDLITSLEKSDDREEYLFTNISMSYIYLGLISLDSRDDLIYRDIDKFSECKIGYAKDSINSKLIRGYLDTFAQSEKIIVYDNLEDLQKALHKKEIDIIATNIGNLGDKEKIINKFLPKEVYFMTTDDNEKLINNLDNALALLQVNEPAFLEKLQNKYFNMYKSIDLTKKEIEYVNQNKIFTVAVPTNRAPVVYVDEKSGEFKGILIDLLYKIEENTGLKFKLKPIDNNESTLKVLEDTNYDLILPFVEEKIYDENYNLKLTAPIVSTVISMATLSNKEILENKNSKIGILKELEDLNIYYFEKYKNFEFIEYNSMNEALIDLKNQKIDGIINTDLSWSYLFQQPEYKGLVLNSNYLLDISFSIGANLSNSKIDNTLFSIIDKGIYTMDSVEVKNVILSYTRAKLYEYKLTDYLYENKLVIGVVICSLCLFCILIHIIIRQIKFKYGKYQNKYNALLEENEIKSCMLQLLDKNARVPINAIIGVSAIGKEITNDSVIREYFCEINSSTEYLLGFINDIFNTFKIYKKELLPYSENVNVTEFFKGVNSALDPFIKNKNIDFKFEIKGLNEDYIYIDKVYMQQIFVNLLSNAMKHSKENGKVEFLLENIEETVSNIKMKVIIRDYGEGINQDLLNKIYNNFGENSNNINLSSKIKQIGIGLTNVYNLVNLMKGKINLSSKLDKGTEFILEIDFPKVYKNSVVRELYDSIDYNFAGKRVILADSYELSTKIIKKFLVEKNIVVDCAKNGKKAIELFLKSDINYYNAILIDIDIEDFNIYNTIDLIYASNRQDIKDIQFIGMTRNIYNENIEKLRNSGVKEFLVKPVKPAMLYVKLYSIFRNK